MPWKATSEMDQREEFVLKAMAKAVPFCELCREYAISPKTGYKWLERFRQRGLEGLHDRSTRPHTSPTGLAEDVVCRIVELKVAHPHWGPRKIEALYARQYPHEEKPSESSFKRVLEKAGLVEKRTPAASAGDDGGRLQLRREANAPNIVWTVDFKGWWWTADSLRCEPLTIRDACSRFILCAEPLANSRTATVRSCFEQVFEMYGLPETMRSDNGAPFASSNGLLGLSELAVWWLSLGISLDRIDPGRPQQNGAHERMHRDMSREIEGLVRGDLAAQRAALSVWRETFNNERPHEALEYRTPAQCYTPSPRKFTGTPERLTYPAGHAERKVTRTGSIKLEQTRIFLSGALRGWNVGLREEQDGLIGVWLGRLRLGTINPRTQAFTAAKPAVEMAP